MKKQKQQIKLHSLVKIKTQNTKRVGRGTGSGHGKTSTRGHKGQRARAGHKIGFAFEGGQMPFYRRVPKLRGFKRPFRLVYQVVDLEKIAQLEVSEVNPQILYQHGLISDFHHPVKILGIAKFKTPISITAHAISHKALAVLRTEKGSFHQL